MKVSIVIPVYYNEGNLIPLYKDIQEKYISKIDYEYEIVMVDDGSGDKSYDVMIELAANDENIKIIHLSRNFGSHAAILCGLDYCTGDCAVVKAADLQEPTEIIHEMVDRWKEGNNVVLAVRKSRPEDDKQVFFSNLYYSIVRKTALKSMPKKGFDVYLLDRKVIEVLKKLDEKNSALTGQILWSGFKTGYVEYSRQERAIGESKWTFAKKIRLVMDTLFSFSTFPIKAVEILGTVVCLGTAVWAIIEFILKMAGMIEVPGWTLLFISQLLGFGITMLTLGILGEYIWRTFDASRNRPPYIVEKDNVKKDE